MVKYRARKIGTVDLVARKTRYCLALDPRMGSCHVVRITVGAR